VTLNSSVFSSELKFQIIPFFSAPSLDSLRSQDGITADSQLLILSLLPSPRRRAYSLRFRSRRPSRISLIRVGAPAVPGSAREPPALRVLAGGGTSWLWNFCSGGLMGAMGLLGWTRDCFCGVCERGGGGAVEGRMQGKAQLSDSNRRIMELDAPPRRVYQAWKGSNVRVSLSRSGFWFCNFS